MSDCPICIQPIKDQIILPCRHTFCLDCIKVSLQHKSNCPLCRRVACLPIQTKWDKDGQNSSMPTLQHDEHQNEQFRASDSPLTTDLRIPIIFGSELLFVVETEEDIQSVNMALRSNLLVAVPRQQFCDIWEIRKIKVKQNRTQIPNGNLSPEKQYECMFRNVGRSKILESTGYSTLTRKLTDSDIENSQEIQVEYSTICQILQTMLDKGTLEEKELIQSTFGVPQPTMRSMQNIEEVSLRLICYLRIDDQNFNKLYYNENLYQRLLVIKRHLEVMQELM